MQPFIPWATSAGLLRLPTMSKLHFSAEKPIAMNIQFIGQQRTITTIAVVVCPAEESSSSRPSLLPPALICCHIT